MGRIETSVKVLAACMMLALVPDLGCSGGINLEGDGEHTMEVPVEADAETVVDGGTDDRGDGEIGYETDAAEVAVVDVDTVPDDGIGDAADTGEDGTCPADVFSDGRCATDGTTCWTDTFCQQCGFDAWTRYAAYCWCAGGSWSCSHADCLPPYPAGTYSDPGCTTSWGGDGDADADADPDADADADPDADADADADDGATTCVTGAECASGVCLDGRCLPVGGDAGGDADGATCAGGWLDPASGLCWQDPPDETLRNWRGAVNYCDGLELGGRDDWRLPTVDDLRSLIRGCAATEISGPCAATGTCLDLGCRTEPCMGCGHGGGPAAGGAYWPSEVTGPVFWYWTSDACTSLPADAWAVFFTSAYVEVLGMIGTTNVRCVRPGP